MKMWKIKVTNYKLSNGSDYPVKESLALILFHPELKLSARDLFKNDAVVKVIESANGDYVLLTNEQYAQLKISTETIHGWSREELELVSRILNAEEVEVEIKEAK